MFPGPGRRASCVRSVSWSPPLLVPPGAEAACPERRGGLASCLPCLPVLGWLSAPRPDPEVLYLHAKASFDDDHKDSLGGMNVQLYLEWLQVTERPRLYGAG